MRRSMLALVLAAAAAALAGRAEAQVSRVGAPTAAIARAVTVPAGAEMIYVSGITAQPADPARPTELGDTRAQTLSILRQIDDILRAQGFTLGDVVMMRVYLVGDPAKGGRMDFAGMMDAYGQFFGAPNQPSKPARVTVQVASLVGPAMLAEIEVQAARIVEPPR